MDKLTREWFNHTKEIIWNMLGLWHCGFILAFFIEFATSSDKRVGEPNEAILYSEIALILIFVGLGIERTFKDLRSFWRWFKGS